MNEIPYLVSNSTDSIWGGLITGITIESLHEQASYWRHKLYERKILVIRGLPTLTMAQLWNLHTIWGVPWFEDYYRTTTERVVHIDGSSRCLTEYGNLITKESIGNRRLPWHRDIPWHREKRYPIRSLYPIKMTSGAGNIGTKFCDADVAWTRLEEAEQKKLRSLQVTIQSWYQYHHKFKEVATKVIPLVERHQLTGRESVLLNSFGPATDGLEYSVPLSGAWILDNLEFVNQLHQVVCTDDNIYTHQWEQGDLVLFDNSSGVFHSRDPIPQVTGDEVVERLFWRLNLRHRWQ